MASYLSLPNGVHILSGHLYGEDRHVISRAMTAGLSRGVQLHSLDLDIGIIHDPVGMFRLLCNAFGFSEYYGLDITALYDMLTSDQALSGEGHITIIIIESMSQTLITSPLLNEIFYTLERAAHYHHNCGTPFVVVAADRRIGASL